MKKLTLLMMMFALVATACSKDENEDQTPPAPPGTEATYQLTIKTQWTQENHPTDFPLGAHFSTPFGFVHNENGHLYKVGELATEGIKRMAELGSNSPLNQEAEEMINKGRGKAYFQGKGSLGNKTEQQIEFTADKNNPLLSLVSMIAPSPDWFIGVNSLSLLDEDGNWIEMISMDLGSYDSGTDSGPTFSSPNQNTNPPVPIFVIAEPPLAPAPGQDIDPDLATITLRLVK